MDGYYLIIHRPGPAWKEGEGFQDQDLMDHGRYIHRLYQQGVAVEGGPFLDHSGGMAIIRAGSVEEAEEIMRSDPALQNGVFVADIHPWMRVDWSSYGG